MPILFNAAVRRAVARRGRDEQQQPVTGSPLLGAVLAVVAIGAIVATLLLFGYRPSEQGVEASAPLIFEIGAVLLAAAGAGWLARRFGLPAVVGYLAVGIAVSPFTPGYVTHRENLRLLADVGVVLLLFEVGIEVDLIRLRREQRGLLWAAPAQVLATTAIGGAVGLVAGLQPIGALLLGLCVALSSSVVIVNITRSGRRTTDPPTERALIGWSVIQDVTGVTIGALLLALAGVETRPLPMALLGLLGFAALAVAAAWLLPRALRQLLPERDLFLIVSVASGLAIAGLGAVIFGLPLALAAFVSGLAIVESDESAAEARRQLLPFRDLFAVLFFVAIGSLIDPAALGQALPWLVGIVVLVIVAKALVSAVLARLARLPARPLQLGIGLGQVGEFSFVLASAGVAVQILPAETYVAMLAAVVVTIAGSTVGVRLVGRGVF